MKFKNSVFLAIIFSIFTIAQAFPQMNNQMMQQQQQQQFMMPMMMTMTNSGSNVQKDVMMLSRLLNLTNDQTVKIMDVKIALEKDVSALKIQIMESQKALFILWSADKLDEKAITKAEKDLYATKGSIAEKEVQARIKIYNILTPEQRKKLPNFGMMGGTYMPDMMNMMNMMGGNGLRRDLSGD